MSNDRATLTTKQVAEILGVGRTTVTRLVQRGELKAYKLTPAKNSPYRIYEDSVNSLLQRRRQTEPD